MWKISNLAPIGIKLFYSDGALGVVATMLEAKLLALLHDGVVHVDCKLIWDVEDVAELPRVCHIHGQDVRGAGYVHESVAI